jgi:Variant SH3 domain
VTTGPYFRIGPRLGPLKMAQLQANSLARVLYDFAAVEASELSVGANDVVLVLENTIEDGWRKVQRQTDGRTGFCPNDYLAPLPSTVVSPTAASRAVSSSVDTSMPSPGDEGESREKEQEQPRAASSSVLSSSSISPAMVAASASAIPFSALPKEYSELLSNHEAWFREATTKRSEVYRNLQGQATDLGRAIAESESRSKALLSRISELEGLINDERAKWNAPANPTPVVPALMMSGQGR